MSGIYYLRESASPSAPPTTIPVTQPSRNIAVPVNRMCVCVCVKARETKEREDVSKLMT